VRVAGGLKLIKG